MALKESVERTRRLNLLDMEAKTKLASQSRGRDVIEDPSLEIAHD